MADRVSQETVEVVEQGAAKSRVSQEVVEVLARYHVGGDRISQVAVEVLWKPAGSVTITAPSGIVNYQSDGASLTFFPGDGGKIFYTGDEPAVFPLVATEATFAFQGDGPSLTGPIQTAPGVIVYKGDPPALAGPINAFSGAFKFRADSPTLWTGITPVSGTVAYKSDQPTIIPIQSGSGVYRLKGDQPTLYPVPGIQGRILYKGDPPVIYPVRVDAGGSIVYAGANATVATATYILSSSGIIRYRADTPVVTPLTEPPPPPPPVSGTGAKIMVTL